MSQTIAKPEITVLVVTYKGADFITGCLHSLAAQTIAHGLLVVDNASQDGTREILQKQFPGHSVLRLTENAGFAGAIELGLETVATPYVALLNDDAVAAPNWLAELLSTLQNHPEAAAATSQMWLSAPSDQLNNIGVALTSDGYGYDIGLGRTRIGAFDKVTPVFGFSGGAALIRTEELRKVGGSPPNFFLYYEDVDMSWRLRLAGHEILSSPLAEVVHRHSATVGQSSVGFHRYNERNRLFTLVRCAPMTVFVRQTIRFFLTTANFAGKKVMRRRVPDSANFSLRLRISVLGELTRSLPRLLQERRRITRGSALDRTIVATQWLGVDPYARISTYPLNPNS